MSVTMTRAEGVTVLTLSSDPQSVCPPLCQILKSLCYNPLCCTVSDRLRRVQRSSQSVLGAVHIMVGLLNIGLGAILLESRYGAGWRIEETGFPFWLGALFILFGIIGILSEKRPSPCLVIINVILNVAGAAFAIAAIVLYVSNVTDIWIWWSCERNYFDDELYYGPVVATLSPEEEIIKRRCLEGRKIIQVFLRGLSSVLVILSVLELCVTISAAVLGIKALCSSERGEEKEIGEPELYSPVPEEVTSNPTA